MPLQSRTQVRGLPLRLERCGCAWIVIRAASLTANLRRSCISTLEGSDRAQQPTDRCTEDERSEDNETQQSQRAVNVRCLLVLLGLTRSRDPVSSNMVPSEGDKRFAERDEPDEKEDLLCDEQFGRRLPVGDDGADHVGRNSKGKDDAGAYQDADTGASDRNTPNGQWYKQNVGSDKDDRAVLASSQFPIRCLHCELRLTPQDQESESGGRRGARNQLMRTCLCVREGGEDARRAVGEEIRVVHSMRVPIATFDRCHTRSLRTRVRTRRSEQGCELEMPAVAHLSRRRSLNLGRYEHF